MDENSVTICHHPFGPFQAGMERQIASASHDVGANGKQARLGVESVKTWRFSKLKGKKNTPSLITLNHPVDGWNPKQPPGMVWNPINNGKNYLSTGAGFQPSTVPLHIASNNHCDFESELWLTWVADPNSGTSCRRESSWMSSNFHPLWLNLRHCNSGIAGVFWMYLVYVAVSFHFDLGLVWGSLLNVLLIPSNVIYLNLAFFLHHPLEEFSPVWLLVISFWRGNKQRRIISTYQRERLSWERKKQKNHIITLHQ